MRALPALAFAVCCFGCGAARVASTEGAAPVATPPPQAALPMRIVVRSTRALHLRDAGAKTLVSLGQPPHLYALSSAGLERLRPLELALGPAHAQLESVVGRFPYLIALSSDRGVRVWNRSAWIDAKVDGEVIDGFAQSERRLVVQIAARQRWLVVEPARTAPLLAPKATMAKPPLFALALDCDDLMIRDVVAIDDESMVGAGAGCHPREPARVLRWQSATSMPTSWALPDDVERIIDRVASRMGVALVVGRQAPYGATARVFAFVVTLASGSLKRLSDLPVPMFRVDAVALDGRSGAWVLGPSGGGETLHRHLWHLPAGKATWHEVPLPGAPDLEPSSLAMTSDGIPFVLATSATSAGSWILAPIGGALEWHIDDD